MAESPDGIRWTRPSLGLYEFNGSKQNNIVWMDKPGEQKVTDCMYVFRDANPAVPADQRYKALGGNSYPLIALVSGDGKSWKQLQGQKSLISEGLHRNAFDALNVAFWDARRNLYVAIFRDADTEPSRASGSTETIVQPNVNYGNRSFKYSTSPRFHTLEQTSMGGLREGCHRAPVYERGHTLLSWCPSVSRLSKTLLALENRFFGVPLPGVSEGVFMSSRDGLHWIAGSWRHFV